MIGDPLPDDDHAARYCKPSVVDSDGLPMASAFEPRRDESYLSINWLEYFGAPEPAAAVQHVRAVFRDKGYKLRSAGRFAVINVGSAKDAVHEGAGKTLRIDHLPLNDDQSHAGIFGYTTDDLALAVELKALVSRQAVHPAVTGGDSAKR